jgi:translation initiation factor 3 subunit M
MTLHPSLLTSPPSRRTTSYQYLLTSLRTLPPNSPHAESSAIQAISTSLKLPSVFDFDTLYKIDAIIKLQGHELFSLLKVFLSGDLEDYKRWESEYSGSIEKYGDCPHCRGLQGSTLTF